MPDSPAAGRAWPKVSIVTPNYNYARYLEQTIRSVLLQGYPVLEYIVMDDGSGDASVEIIRKYAPWLTYWQTAPNQGQSRVINQGFERATGEVFGWVNSDDLLLPGALRTIMHLAAETPEAVAWVGACRELDGEDKPLREVAPKLPDEAGNIGDWGHSAHFYQPSCFFRADAFRRAGGLRECLDRVMDVDLWIRLDREGAFVATPALVSEARLHAGTKTFGDIPMRECEVLASNVISGSPQVARQRYLRQMQRSAEREIKKLSEQDVLTRFGYGRLADHVKYSRILSYFAGRTLDGIRRRFFPGREARP